MTIEGKVPPVDLDAEAAVLSAVMLDPVAMGRVSDFLTPEMFYSESHRRIFEAAVYLREHGTAIDVQTVGSRLNETDRLRQVGGFGYLTEILDASPVVQNVRTHAVTVHERWRARQVIRLCQKAEAEGYGTLPDVQRYASEVAEAAIDIARRYPGRVIESNIDTLKRIVRDIATAATSTKNGVERGMSTGFPGIDELILGMHAGHKLTVVALPGVGKTTLGLQLAMRVARNGIGAIVFSTEMSRDELGERQLAQLARVDYLRIRKARAGTPMTGDEMSRLGHALTDLRQTNLHMEIHDDADVTVEDIAARSRLFKEQLAIRDIPLGVVVVDYVQRLKPSSRFATNRNVNKYEIISHSTMTLKNVANDLGVCVVELAQQKANPVDKKTGQRPPPNQGDVAECSRIERESDEVLYLWRANDRNMSDVTATLTKARSGLKGDVPLVLRGEYSLFEEATY